MLTIARLKREKDYDTDPLAFGKLSDALYRTAGWRLGVRPPRSPGELEPGEIDVLWLTGHEFPEFSDEEVEAIRAYLAGGGFLVATAACGRQSFSQGFERLGPRLVDGPLVDLPKDHPIRRGRNSGVPYSDLASVRYKRGFGSRPVNYETIFEKLGFVDCRAVLFTSPFDITCGLDGHPCPTCLGLIPRDATALAINVLLYVIETRPVPNASASN